MGDGDPPRPASTTDGAGPSAAAPPAQPPRLSVVVPVFNGEDVIASTLAELAQHFASQQENVELIVVDDGSTDRTAAIVTSFAAQSDVSCRLERLPVNRGKGAAVRHGVLAAYGEEVLFTDADLAFTPASLDALRAALGRGAQLAIANRSHPDSRLEVSTGALAPAVGRHLASRGFSWLVRTLLLPGIDDSQAGLKGFTAEAAHLLFSDPLPAGFGFDLALLARARRLGLALAQVPVVVRRDGTDSTVRFGREWWRLLRDLFAARRREGFHAAQETAGESPAPSRRRRGLTPELAVAAVLGVALWLWVIPHPSLPLSLVAWLALLAATLWGAAVAAPARRPRAPSPHWTRWELIAVAAILLAGGALRFISLDDVPATIHHDSVSCGLVGRELLAGKSPTLFHPSFWYDFPSLSCIPYAASFQLLGESIATLRLPSAFAGTAAIGSLYLFTRTGFGVRAALTAAAAMATSHVAIHFSRIGLWNIQAALLVAAGGWLLLEGLRRRSGAWLAGAGIVAGLGWYSYTGARLLTVLAGAAVVAFWVRGRGRGGLSAAAPVAAGLVVAILPLLFTYLHNPLLVARDRAPVVFVFSAINRAHVEATLDTTAPLPVLVKQARATLAAMVSAGDTSTQFGSEFPLLPIGITGLAVVGLAVAVRRWREPPYAMLAGWALVGALLASVLTLNPPFYPRLLVILPACCALAGVALHEILLAAARRARHVRRLAAACAVAVIALAATVEVRRHVAFNRWIDSSYQNWDVVDVVQELQGEHDCFLFTAPGLYADSPLFTFLRGCRRTINCVDALDLPTRLEGDAVFILPPERRRIGLEITTRFPAIRRQVVEAEGRRQLTLYWHHPADELPQENIS